MIAAWRICREEWRYWSRSRLAIAAALLAAFVSVAAVTSTMAWVSAEASSRQTMQTAAEEAFRSQPDRHPHRMVHYGHYVFRTPAPLAVLDPGVDRLTGSVMFLEGHRQNSATFPPTYASPQVAGFERLTPAFTYQVLVPLLLIVVGFSVVARERELGTDVQLTAQGVRPGHVVLGKFSALFSLALLLMAPLVLGSVLATRGGEPASTAATLVFAYGLYLAFWSLAIVAISAHASRPALALLGGCVAWTLVAVVVPRIAADVGATASPVSGRIESDLALLEDLREVGDGHNVADPAFEGLRARVLAEYGAERPEDLPVNMRGIVAEASEARLTEVLNRYAEARMAAELQQAELTRRAAFLSPTAALRTVSMRTAGTDLENHHRFLRAAENARFDFVQELNRVHIQELSYIDDVNRNLDEASGIRARVSADNWRVLQSFDFAPAAAGERLRSAAPYLLLLLLWTVGTAWFALAGVRNTEGWLHAR
ncbi:MAG: DUF3526 domain-containing protein [Gemmatimonadota bacterium]